MGIRLDWEIEADQKAIRSRGEDPDTARSRRRARFRLLLTIFTVLVVIGAVVAFIAYRSEQVDRQLETLLTDTVAAEVTALRLGDFNAFAEFQRSASPDWLARQRDLFEQYQTLLLRNVNVQLTGRVTDMVIDDPRGRVMVEEIVDGVPYVRTWFYWRFEPEYDQQGEVISEGGWHHVPPDYTFWGEPGQFTSEHVRVDYMAIDEGFANALGARFDEWLTLGCNVLACEGVPQVRVFVHPNLPDGIRWATQDPWALQVRSPFATRARADMPFSPEMQIEAATLLAERLVLNAMSNQVAVPETDAAYLQQAVVSWLTGRFVLIDTGTHLIASLAQTDNAVGQLLQVLQPTSSISVISEVTGLPLDQSNLDWRDFFTWRLRLENQFTREQRLEPYLALYAPTEGVQSLARSRFSVPPAGEPTVTLVQPTDPADDGAAQVVASVNIRAGETTREAQVIFRLVNNVWLRAS